MEFAWVTATLTAFVSCLGRDTFLQLIIPATTIYMREFEGLIWYIEAVRISALYSMGFSDNTVVIM